MSRMSWEFLQAALQNLSADTSLLDLLGGDKVFDKVPENRKLPYVVIGRTTLSDWSTATEDGEAIIVFVHAWSRSQGREELDQILQRVESAIGTFAAPMATTQLVNLRRQFGETQRDPATGNLHGLLRFRAVLEPRS